MMRLAWGGGNQIDRRNSREITPTLDDEKMKQSIAFSDGEDKYIVIMHVLNGAIAKYKDALQLLGDIERMGLLDRLCGGFIKADYSHITGKSNDYHVVMFVKCGPNIQVCNSHDTECYHLSKNVPNIIITEVYYVIAPVSVELDMYMYLENDSAHLHIPWTSVQSGDQLSFQLAVLDERASIVEEVLVCINRKSGDNYLATVIEILIPNSHTVSDHDFRPGDKILAKPLDGTTVHVDTIVRDGGIKRNVNKVMKMNKHWEKLPQPHTYTEMTTNDLLDALKTSLKGTEHTKIIIAVLKPRYRSIGNTELLGFLKGMLRSGEQGLHHSNNHIWGDIWGILQSRTLGFTEHEIQEFQKWKMSDGNLVYSG